MLSCNLNLVSELVHPYVAAPNNGRILQAWGLHELKGGNDLMVMRRRRLNTSG